MIKIWCKDPQDNIDYLWDGEFEHVFIYSNFVELVTEEIKHEIVPMANISHIEFDDYDIAHKRIKIMEPVRHKQ